MNLFASCANSCSNDQWATDKEIEIIYKLGQEVLDYEDVLVHASELCGELDRSRSGLD